MRQWWPVSALADALAENPVAGWPSSRFRLHEMLQKYATEKPSMVRVMRGRHGGGGYEYRIDLLPPVMQLMVRLQAARAEVQDVSAGVQDIDLMDIPAPDTMDKRLLKRDAIMMVLYHYDAYARDCPLGGAAAIAAFCTLYTEGKIKMPAWAVKALHGTRGQSLCERTLRNWIARRDGGDYGALAGRYGNRKRQGILDTHADGAVAKFMAARILQNAFLTADHLRDMVASEWPHMALPSRRTFQLWVKNWRVENAEAFTRYTNPDRFKSAMRITGSNMNHWVVRPNQLWEIDASPADVMCTDGRFSIYACLDIWTRRMVVLVSHTARTDAVLSVVRRGIMAWGVPEIIRTDNGADFTSHRAKTALAHLAVQVDVTAPFSPEQKGSVERAIGTLQRGLMRTLPGFTGHNVADRQQLRGRRAFSARLGEDEASLFGVSLSSAELQTIIDDWLDSKYEHTPHAGLKGETPRIKALSHDAPSRRIMDERALDIMLAPLVGADGYRTASKQGIRHDGALFWCMDIVPGTRYFCKQDPADMGRVFVFDESGADFVGIAECAERLGIDPAVAVREARDEQARRIKEELDPLRKEIKKIKPRDAIERINAVARRRGADIVSFPSSQNTEPYTSPALVATTEAGAAGDGGRTPLPSPAATIDPELMERLHTPHRADELASTEGRIHRARRLLQRVERDQRIGADELQWLRAYQATPEFRGWATVNDFTAPDLSRVGA